MTAETNTSVVEGCQSVTEKAPAVREPTGRLGSQHVLCKSVYAGICRSTRRGDLIGGSPGIHVKLALWCGLAKGEDHGGTIQNNEQKQASEWIQITCRPMLPPANIPPRR